MTEGTYPVPVYGTVPPTPPPPPPSTVAAAPIVADLRAARLVAAVLVVVGALLGPLWAWWAPPGPLAVIYPGGAILPDENENFIGGDGRYLVIVAAVGVVAGIVAWRLTRVRGPVMAIALAVGSIAGSLLTWWVGHLTGGGDGTGALRQLTDGTSVRVTQQLPLGLQSHGFVFVEAAIAVGIYAVCVAFTAHDDLGRPDPVRDRLTRPPAAAGADAPGWSVDAGDHPQGGWGYGDAPGAPQQGDLPPQ